LSTAFWLDFGRQQFNFLMQQQQRWIAYRKDAVSIGTIFEKCDKQKGHRSARRK